MEGEGPSHGTLAGFAPRKSSYLRISPTLVLQLILYLEPHHVEWMNVGVFERMLVALKERIPRKLEQEAVLNKANKYGTGGGKQKDKVDVFRGTDYQMAFFFRKTNDKHVVLLKEKHLHYVTKSVPRRRPTPRRHHPHTKPSSQSHDPHHHHHHPQDQDDYDDNEGVDQDALGVMGPPPMKRRRRRHETSSVLPRGSDDSSVPLVPEEEENQQDGSGGGGGGGGSSSLLLSSVKPEPIEEPDPSTLFSREQEQEEEGTRLFRQESQTPAPVPFDGQGRSFEQGEGEGEGEEEEEVVKEELDEDIKPQLKVNYQKFDIFNRSLVVIVEPYPPLPASQISILKQQQQQNSSSSSSTATPFSSSRSTTTTTTTNPGEIRQLSASVQPVPTTRRSEFIDDDDDDAAYSRAGTLSVTPAPPSFSSRRGGGGGSLFRRTRSETTPLEEAEERRGMEEEDEQMTGFREMSQVFSEMGGDGTRDPDDDEDEDEDEDEDLPSVEEMLERRKKRREVVKAVREG